MDRILVIAVGSGIVSLFLLTKVWRSSEHLAFKIAISFVTVIPIVGPVFYLFVANNTPPQDRCLQNKGPRGEYAHRWLSVKPLYQNIIDEKKADDGAQQRENT